MGSVGGLELTILSHETAVVLLLGDGDVEFLADLGEGRLPKVLEVDGSVKGGVAVVVFLRVHLFVEEGVEGFLLLTGEILYVMFSESGGSAGSAFLVTGAALVAVSAAAGMSALSDCLQEAAMKRSKPAAMRLKERSRVSHRRERNAI